MARVRRVRPRHDDEPKTGPESLLLGSHDVAQPPAHAIPDDGSANMFRRDESGAKRFLLRHFGRAENQIAAALGGSLPFHPRKLRRQYQPFRFREGQWFPAPDPDL